MIRSATSDDVGAVARLERVCLGSDAWSQALLAEGIAGALPTIRYLVAEEDGEVVGYAVASILADVAELQRIAVDPGRRRSATGTRLLGAVTTEAASAGAERLLLEVRETNAGALAFYAAHGFAEIDRRPRYYGDGTSAIVLGLPLRPAHEDRVSP